jgi:hypothetical protein
MPLFWHLAHTRSQDEDEFDQACPLASSRARQVLPNGMRYLWVMVKTPSQPEGGSSKRYSWQRFQ